MRLTKAQQEAVEVLRSYYEDFDTITISTFGEAMGYGQRRAMEMLFRLMGKGLIRRIAGSAPDDEFEATPQLNPVAAIEIRRDDAAQLAMHLTQLAWYYEHEDQADADTACNERFARDWAKRFKKAARG